MNALRVALIGILLSDRLKKDCLVFELMFLRRSDPQFHLLPHLRFYLR